jgi:hypothetical protein
LPIPPPSKSPSARRPGAAGSFAPMNPPGKLSPARPAPSAPAPQGPGSGQYRGPAETFDSLPDPFIDDSQSQRPTRSATRQVGYWDAW